MKWICKRTCFNFFGQFQLVRQILFLIYDDCFSEFVQKNQDEMIESVLKNKAIAGTLADKWILYVAGSPTVNFSLDWIKSELFVPIDAFVNTDILTHGIDSEL